MLGADGYICQSVCSSLAKFFALVLLGCWVAALAPGLSFSAEPMRERRCVWDGKFYPSSAVELKALIQKYLDQAEIDSSLISRPGLKAVVMPHAGYIYSGPVAAYAAKLLQKKTFSKVFILGPDHRVGFEGGAVTDADAYTTPLGRVALHSNAKDLLRNPLFKRVPASDQSDHSLEVEIPFLQQVLGSFTIIPVVLSSADPLSVAESILPYLDDATLVVVSSDLSHYLPYQEAVEKDSRTISLIKNLDFSGLAAAENANSGDTSGIKDQVVGYAAMACFKTESVSHEQGLGPEEGRYLLSLARKTIAQQVHEGKRLELDLSAVPSSLRTECAAFVTLTKHGRLRGCIGSLNPEKPLVECVRDNAINAAFSDPRFPPVSASELPELDIEVSVLSSPQPLLYKGSEDLLKKLRPGVDGVIIKQGYHQATFLPQVWEQLPQAQDFLSRLCEKAGLAPDAWMQEDMEVFTYRVQAFHEEK
jgi:AmmeMemoRadiSam system protein A/AmmeMemoRadiSam system protein B